LCPRAYSFFYNRPPPTQTYPLSLHDALPISNGGSWSHHSAWPNSIWTMRLSVRCGAERGWRRCASSSASSRWRAAHFGFIGRLRSEEHTSELQSLRHLVCRLLLEKKKTKNFT